MTLQKAIKSLQHKVSQNVFQVDPDAFTALKLGIEAIKCIKATREETGCGSFGKLPGETTD